MSDPTQTMTLVETDGYLEAELPGRPLRQRIGRSTVVLLILALLAIAFFSGVVIEKGQVKSNSATTSLAALAARFRAAAGASGNGGGTGGLFGGGGGGGVSGTVTLVDGNDVYITQVDGSIVKAVTSPSSQVTVTSAGTVQSLHPGDNVTVQGPTDSSGNVTATSIRDNGAGGGGGGGRRGGGGSGGGSPSPASQSAGPAPGGD